MSKIKRVLSIDMDYIMAPSISLYEDLIGRPEFKGQSFWSQVNSIRNVDAHIEYDKGSLLFLIRLFSKSIAGLDPRNIFFCEEHDMILEFLTGDAGKSGEVFDLYNVDHHHDVYFNDRQKEEVERFDFACLANWVYYLGDNEKLAKYHWVRNAASSNFNEEDKKDLLFPFEEILEGRDRLFDIEFDYVCVCKSNDYFPEKYHQFFYMLKEIAEGLKGGEFFVWNTDYCENGRTRHVCP